MNIPSISEMPYRKGANAIFINSENEILIVQKSSYNDNEWDLPGGGLEDDETPEQGITRELIEELGVSNFKIIGQSKYINTFEWPEDVITRGFSKRNKWYRGQEKFQFVVEFLGSKNEIKLQEEEIKDSKWVNASDLERYFVFPNQFENIQKVLREFQLNA